jgi:ABC-type Fe2+-enterobactin transport system substrate-binding protein
MCSDWHLQPMAATEPDVYLQGIAAGTGSLTPYIDLASPINPTLIIEMTG